jgi:hypothetical protein
VGNHCTLTAKKAENKAANLDETPNFGWGILSIEEWL